MTILVGILEEGLIYAIMALGYILPIKFWISRTYLWTAPFLWVPLSQQSQLIPGSFLRF